ncbi:MAG: protein kinase [Planctomycetaceae bacterium]
MENKTNLDDTIVRPGLTPSQNTGRDELPHPVPADLSGFLLEEKSEQSIESQAGSFIGRYQIIRRLGRGGFGIVFLAKDADLDRLVAVKLPHLHRAQHASYLHTFLREAQTLARLDHPAIVPIFDCGLISDGRCFVVSKYIEGRDLAHVMAQGPMPHVNVARLLIDVAQALDHVHRARIVHRDIKPANILVGDNGRIFVADFGLALRDEPVSGDAEGLAGTPSYMSPEQVRGEGHRIDGRSDQFSLGVVMYEMLTGEKPFSGGASHDVLYRILTRDPVPPRELKRSVPAELNRICLKLLSKLASQRYNETIELADDLREWVSKAEAQKGDPGSSAKSLARVPNPPENSRDTSAPLVTIVPRGLRAFSRADAYFFLSLLPGARDRDGLPECISHWKRWVSVRDDVPDLQRVGVISGPTGCGKSSLVRAGLVPLMGSEVISFVLEASADLTEKQLFAAIERHCSNLTSNTLPEALAEIRRGGGFGPNRSLLIVLDQFEQWLHAHPDPADTELVRSIRQCDGVRVQCVVLIRDDFWLALNRFMEAVESPLQLGRNAMMIDLFDRRHARKVLIEFGRGYGQLPAAPEPPDRDQERFIDGAIDNLAHDDKVIPVHLALFAEMVKSKDWIPSTLRILGGTVGIGAQFLNDSFSATYAPANQKAHDEAARKILKTLVPGLGIEIKASRRTRAELLAVSGYENDRARFDMLMTIMESDLKLISATETLDKTRSESSPSTTEQSTYQLSHDFLVPSIREWLTAKQRESFRGRLHQRLTEQAGLWSQQKENRFLPGFWEWMQIRTLLPGSQLSAEEKEMMAVRDRRSLASVLSTVMAIVVLGIVLFRYDQQIGVNSLRDQLIIAEPERLPLLIDELARHGSLARTAITESLKTVEQDSSQSFALQLAHLRWDDSTVENVFASALTSSIPENAVLAADALSSRQEDIIPRCWKIVDEVEDSDDGFVPINDDTRFRSLVILAKLDPPGNEKAVARWDASAVRITDILIHACTQHPDRYRLISTSLQPAAATLIPQLSRTLGVSTEDLRGSFALSLLIDYLGTDHAARSRLALDASDWQIDRMVPPAKELDIRVLRTILNSEEQYNKSHEVQNQLAHRKAMAIALLLKHSNEAETAEIWKHFQRTAVNIANTTRSQAMRLLAFLNVPPERLLKRLRTETDPGVQYALLIALGDYKEQQILRLDEIRTFLATLHRETPDAGVHSAAEWLMRRWGNPQPAANLPAETAETALHGPKPPRQWMKAPRLASCDGHTLIRVAGKSDSSVGRDFLIAAHEVSVQQAHEFDPTMYNAAEYSRTPDSPMSVVQWHDAAAYCNWLSRREGLPEFYPPNFEEWDATADDFKQPGYRLPTVSEWRLAALAGTGGERFFGSDLSLHVRYGWCYENNAEYLRSIGAPSLRSDGTIIIVSKPVGLLRPNDFGLFDVHGNVAEWCNDSNSINRGDNGQPLERAMMGGAAGGSSQYDDISVASFMLMNIKYNSHGIRVARTIPER